jgi:hypothetical protein
MISGNSRPEGSGDADPRQEDNGKSREPRIVGPTPGLPDGPPLVWLFF